MKAVTPDFRVLAPRYDDLRPPDASWREVFDALVREADLVGRRVLDVGCGTGTLVAELAARGSKAWGVDPSEEMLAVARAKVPAAGLKLARAESLPFKDQWFERVTMVLAAHLVDRPAAFAEAFRVLAPGGRFGIVTFAASHFGTYWLRNFFPSLEAIDRARFPTEHELSSALREAGFAEPRLVALRQEGELARAVALERIRGRHISTFQLLDEQEYTSGLERAERELPEPVPYVRDWLIAVGGR